MPIKKGANQQIASVSEAASHYYLQSKELVDHITN
jgi:hypothetical protein